MIGQIGVNGPVRRGATAVGHCRWLIRINRSQAHVEFSSPDARLQSLIKLLSQAARILLLQLCLMGTLNMLWSVGSPTCLDLDNAIATLKNHLSIGSGDWSVVDGRAGKKE